MERQTQSQLLPKPRIDTRGHLNGSKFGHLH